MNEINPSPIHPLARNQGACAAVPRHPSRTGGRTLPFAPRTGFGGGLNHKACRTNGRAPARGSARHYGEIADRGFRVGCVISRSIRFGAFGGRVVRASTHPTARYKWKDYPTKKNTATAMQPSPTRPTTNAGPYDRDSFDNEYSN